jgi:hypothetical protein
MNSMKPFLGLLLSVGAASAATVSVDWLQLAPGATPGAFALTNDAGETAVTGRIAISSGGWFPVFPSAASRAAHGWQTTPPASDSVTGGAAVSGFEVRVAPANGAASYTVELAAPQGREMVIAVGGLYSTSSGGTSGVGISAASGSGASVITDLGAFGWSNGIQSFSGDLDWDGNFLTPLPEGESGFAFFRIAPFAGPDGKIFFNIPAAFAGGSGDSITFAIGFSAVPEPAASALAAGAALALAFRRRRRAMRRSAS